MQFLKFVILLCYSKAWKLPRWMAQRTQNSKIVIGICHNKLWIIVIGPEIPHWCITIFKLNTVTSLKHKEYCESIRAATADFWYTKKFTSQSGGANEVQSSPDCTKPIFLLSSILQGCILNEVIGKSNICDECKRECTMMTLLKGSTVFYCNWRISSQVFFVGCYKRSLMKSDKSRSC